MGKKYKTTVEVDENIAIKLKEMASNDDRTLTNYIRKVLTDHVSTPEYELITSQSINTSNNNQNNDNEEEDTHDSKQILQPFGYQNTDSFESDKLMSKKIPPIKERF